MNRTICLLYGNSSVNGETETLGGIIFVRAYKNLEKIVEKIPALNEVGIFLFQDIQGQFFYLLGQKLLCCLYLCYN